MTSNGKPTRAPKPRDLTLTATERTAVSAVFQAEQNLQAQWEQLQQEKAAILADIERSKRLPIGAFQQGTHHIIDGRVEEVPAEPEPQPKPRRRVKAEA